MFHPVDAAGREANTMAYPSSSEFAAGPKAGEGIVEIRLFGEFVFNYCGGPVAATAWQRSHAKRLVQMLCSAPRLVESRSRVLAALWPGFDEDRARNRLHHTIHYLRKACDEIPLPQRPRIVVSTDRVEFIAAPGTLIDVQAFVQEVEADCVDPAERLALLTQALVRYRGEMAPGWDDCAEIDARRTWLAKLRESALREAIDTAIEIGRPAVALHQAHQLALLLENDGDAHCQYALLLADNGRADAALLYCQGVRDSLEADDARALALLDHTVHSIQQQSNRSVVVERHAANTPHEEASGVVSRQCVAAPTRRLIGYELLAQVCARCIEDPFGSIVSLVGPPGCGKSLLASTVAHAAQSSLRHGALWIDCADITGPQALLDAISWGLEPLCGPVAADEAALRHTLQNKEMLIVLDGLRLCPPVVRHVNALALAGRDTRWLVTAWSALHVTGERVLHAQPSHLMQVSVDGMPSAAAQIVSALTVPSWQLEDARSARLIESIAGLLDGLPQLLEIAAQNLQSMSPSELLARLQRDPCFLMRSSQDEKDSPGARLAASVDAWLEDASPAVRRVLALLGRCQTWLTRDDIVCLLGDADTNGVDLLIERCVRHQFLLRRTQDDESAPRSEFRVPRIASASLRLHPPLLDPDWCQTRLEHWLMRGHLTAPDAASSSHAWTLEAERGSGVAAARWFDRHIDDIDGVATGWLESGRFDALAALCAAHAANWSLAKHGERVLAWLVGLGENIPSADPAVVARLLVERARVRVHFGQLQPACADASRALKHVGTEPDLEVHEQAVQLIQRYGAEPSQVSRVQGALCARGVEAGESLLRVAQLAVRHGELAEALSMCGQSVEVFTYFGLTHGLIKAHQFRAKIAFAFGNTDLALRCLAEVERAAMRVDDRREVARAGLMHADVLLSKMQFSQAIDLASSLIARPACSADPALVARGIGVVAWAHYGQGAYPLARALCTELREKAGETVGTSQKLNAAILSALVEARARRPEAALRHASAALGLRLQDVPVSDAQSDLVNTAELALYLGRHDLAMPVANSLLAFSRRPDHRLRDWVSERIRSISGAAQLAEQPVPEVDASAGTSTNPSEVLATLLAA